MHSLPQEAILIVRYQALQILSDIYSFIDSFLPSFTPVEEKVPEVQGRRDEHGANEGERRPIRHTLPCMHACMHATIRFGNAQTVRAAAQSRVNTKHSILPLSGTHVPPAVVV